MANYPSAVKRNRQAPKRRSRNRNIVGSMRAALKKARTAIESGDEKKGDIVRQAMRAIDKAVTKGAVRRQTASRTISRLARSLNKA